MKRNPLTKRIEIIYDAMVDRKILKFLDLHPSKMGYIKKLIMADYKRYLRNPTAYKRKWGLVKEEAPM